MACLGSKRTVAIILYRLGAHRQLAYDYSSWPVRGHRVSKAGVIHGSVSFAGHHLYCPSSVQMFTRGFSVGATASEQMSLIKQLRERTSAPIKDVKAALVGCSWDIEAAVKDLRKRGVILATKKSSRRATEGLLAIAQNEKKAAVIELNCETDFVARNEIFQYLALSLARITLSVESSASQFPIVSPLGTEVLEGMKLNLDHPKLNGEITVQSAVTEVAAMVGENVKLRRAFALSTSSHGVISSYLHVSPQAGLGRIAGIISLEVENDNVPLDALEEVGSSLAMHIVAAKPLFLSKELISSEAFENERDILKTQAESTGKPQMAIKMMVEGRLRKYMEEVVLLEQKYVVNDSVSVKECKFFCLVVHALYGCLLVYMLAILWIVFSFGPTGNMIQEGLDHSLIYYALSLKMINILFLEDDTRRSVAQF